MFDKKKTAQSISLQLIILILTPFRNNIIKTNQIRLHFEINRNISLAKGLDRVSNKLSSVRESVQIPTKLLTVQESPPSSMKI